jgi:Ca-activated chloride channel homolog
MVKYYYKISQGKRILQLFVVITVLFSNSLYGQQEKKYIRQGNRAYDKARFTESETYYRKATDKNKISTDAIFNTGDALYKQKKFGDASKQFIDNINMVEDRAKKSAAMYNLGNSFLKADSVEKSIDAYKGSLKLNPENPMAKYNLAYAQDLLRKQQQQKQQQQQNKDKQDKNKDKNKKDQNKNDDKKDQQKNDKQNQDQQKPQDQQGMTKDDAQRLLNALANEEKEVQEKVKLAKAAKERVRTVKNW